jgi:hypothetical protein
MATANLITDNTPLGIAMREAFAVVLGTAPFAPARGETWPHPDRAVRDRFHAHWTMRAQQLTGLDPATGRSAAEQARATPNPFVQRYEAGESAKMLAAELGIRPGALCLYVRRHGGRVRTPEEARELAMQREPEQFQRGGRYRRGTIADDGLRARVRALFAAGERDYRIAAALGISRQRVAELRGILGLHRPPRAQRREAA